MTPVELEKVVRDLARDLRLDPSQRYELGAFGKQLLSLPDEEVRARSHEAAGRATTPTLGGALAMVGMAIREQRKLSSMSGDERRAYTSALTRVGADLDDSGSVYLDEVEGAEE